MTVNRYIKLLIIAVLLFSVLVTIVACSSEGASVPIYQPVTAAPPEDVTVDQLLSDYLADKDEAEAKYKDKRIMFTGVEVEKITQVYQDSANNPYIYIVNKNVEFRPRYNIDTALVREGFVVDIVGEVRGFFGVDSRYFIVEDCWVNIVEGDIGAELVLDDY